MSALISSLLIVEDDLKLQTGLRTHLAESTSIDSVHASSNLADAKSALRQYQPQVVLLDVGLPDGNGLTLLLDPYVQKHRIKVLILSSMTDEETIVKAIRLGAQGYLLKQDTSANIEQALLSIMQGVPPLSPSVAQCILQHLRTGNLEATDPSTQPEITLPPRQQMTLNLLARGMTYREIAADMEITFHTVSTYAQEIYNKLAARSRSEAVYKAQQMGIIQSAQT